MAHSRFALVCLLGTTLGTACSGSPAGNGSGENRELIPACAWPAAADTFDAASGAGCSPRSMFDICEVPSGSVLDADGSITTPDGGVVRCSDYCSPAQYALTCYGPEPGAISSPAPSLGCTVIPIPTPSGELFYCCPCR